MFKKQRAITVIIVILILLVVFFRKNYVGSSVNTDASFRDTTHLVYTKHARCRMGCRYINEREIKEIISAGKLNERKSGMSDHNDETYALEGYSYQNQHIRVVVAPANDGLLVITVIDLNKDWPCNCN